MFVALSVLLILLFALGFWIVKESKVSTSLKVLCITLFFSFCVAVAASLEANLGWATGEKNLPRIVTIIGVVIKEPNPVMNFDGSIYLLINMPPSSRGDSVLERVFSHKPEGTEPRLFRLPYSRGLHETLQKNVIPRIMKGQSVTGRIGKGKGEGSGQGDGDFDGEGNGNGNSNGHGNGRGHGNQLGAANGQGGGGSESLNTDYKFYELPQSYFLKKE